ncbi:hypothetical protein P9265_19525 [Schinkia azotoformans]|uniref:hypothetical protein n=1 Tax=Schinkia azotoformans TaxID=1454 RepID=UPI002E1E3F41|nr:hypothetical protein [Schinkia azotoformans]
MYNIEIKLKNGDSHIVSIAKEGHAHVSDIFKSIKDAILEEEKFVEFSTVMIDIEQISSVALVESEAETVTNENNQEKQPDKINPNSLFNIKPNEEIAKLLKDGAWDGIQKNIDINRNIPQPKIPDWSNILKKDN